MEKRFLGKSGLAVSQLGFGCMGMSEFYGPSDDAQSLATLEHAFARGVDFFDTADMYGRGHNESLVGRFLKGKRERVVLATKFGIVREDDAGTGYPRRRVDNDPAYIARACEASLKRLGVETIDLYYAHRKEAGRPIEETVAAMARLVEAGKVRAIGLSEVSAETLRRAHAVHPIAALQSEYSLWSREPEANGTLAACAELGIAFVAYSPLGRGFLTGAIASAANLATNDFRRFSPRFSGANIETNRALVAGVGAIAAAKGCTGGQLVLAWLLAQSPHVVPIPGTRRIAHLDDNLGAVAVTLTPGEIQAIDAAFPRGATAGERYPEEGMKGLDA